MTVNDILIAFPCTELNIKYEFIVGGKITFRSSIVSINARDIHQYLKDFNIFGAAIDKDGSLIIKLKAKLFTYKEN